MSNFSKLVFKENDQISVIFQNNDIEHYIIGKQKKYKFYEVIANCCFHNKNSIS